MYRRECEIPKYNLIRRNSVKDCIVIFIVIFIQLMFVFIEYELRLFDLHLIFSLC